MTEEQKEFLLGWLRKEYADKEATLKMMHILYPGYVNAMTMRAGVLHYLDEATYRVENDIDGADSRLHQYYKDTYGEVDS